MLSIFDEIPARERIIVALDCPRDEALSLADDLRGHAIWLKVGMTLYYACGPSIVSELREKGFKVFLDLKLHDIPHQVRGAAEAAARSGADMLTMHVSGGSAMLEAGRQGALAGSEGRSEGDIVTLGITVLTSMDEPALASVGVPRTPEEQVALLGDVAKRAGISGVVASPREAAALRSIMGDRAYIVTPGVRPKGSEKGDQSRISTPSDAFCAGASHIVVGRPITQAKDPVQAFERICGEIA
ncbi:orotidine-5'-phosphate decarboxylase [Gordonibacter sp. Marseille-P4307]|uniref:orotidine-5'-phosphate decarboxylase n=1 Tax=Gordonibacter sp. Marseille-P4307 TaxID=2161815 RepID=UPI000F540FD1|nr:orotidine-5'-phosphate decarboxylase [Gordonibacter sp. Marseille-P4307]